MSFFKSLSTVVSVLTVSILAGCGGSGGGAEKGGLTACTPAEAPVGATVTCEAGKIEEGCTLFVGSQPVDFTYDAEAGTVSFQVPAVLAGSKKITSQCGDSGVNRIESSFQVIAKPSAVPTAPAGEAPVAANDGDVILPSGDPSSDIPSVENPSNPAPETPAEPAAPAAPAVQTFNVDKAVGAALSTYRVTWSVTGAKAAYFWGTALNRSDDDKNAPEDARCGLTADGRYLAVNSDGNKLIAGSPNFDKYKTYAEGVLCKNTDDVTTNNCDGSAEPFVAPAPVDDQPQTDSENDAPLQGIALNKSAISSVIKKGLPMTTPGQTPDHAPSCRIDLTSFSGEFFTRSLAKNGKICLAIQGSDDAWSVQCRAVDAPKAGLAEGEANVIVSTERPVVVLDFNYFNAVSAPEAEGCVATGSSSPSAAAGNGHYHAECKIKKDAMTVSLKVQGVGKGNVGKRSYRVDFAKPQAEMKFVNAQQPDGTLLLSNQEGQMKLQYKATRSYTITDLTTDTVISAADASCPWVNGIRLYGLYVIDGAHVLHPDFIKVEKAADAKAFVTVYRDAYNYFWSFGAFDFEGFPKTSNVVGPSETSAFGSEVSILESSNECSKTLKWLDPQDPRDIAVWAVAACGDDLNCYRQGIRWGYGGNHRVEVALKATNIQSLKISCVKVANSPFAEDEAIGTPKSYGPYSGSQFPVIEVLNGDYRDVKCEMNYEGLGGKYGKIETHDSCIGYDYGDVSTATKEDVKKLLYDSGMVYEDMPF